MDPSLAKALIGGGLLTAIIPLLIGLMTAFTSRRANQIAERKMLVDEDTASLKEAREWREENRSDLKREQERGDMLQSRLEALETLYEARVMACRACDYPCMDKLREQAALGGPPLPMHDSLVSPPLPLPPPSA